MLTWKRFALLFLFFLKKPSGRQILPGIRSLRGAQALAGEGHPCAWLNASIKTGLLHSTESALLRSGETKPVLCLKLQCNQCFLSLLYYFCFSKIQAFQQPMWQFEVHCYFSQWCFFLAGIVVQLLQCQSKMMVQFRSSSDAQRLKMLQNAAQWNK